MEMKEVNLNEILNEIKKIRQEYQSVNTEEKLKQFKNFNEQIEKGINNIKNEEQKKIIENILDFFNVEYENLIKDYVIAKNDTIDICDILINSFENVKGVINDNLFQNFKVKLDFDKK